jgi:formylglycine-generating enzyme required for sulfatase activity
MGSDTSTDVDERPAHQYCFNEPFWIDKFEAVQGDFERLSGAKVDLNKFSGALRPVEHVTWFEAQAFCQQRGGSLPTEDEWEYAARGPDSLEFPWGNEMNMDLLSYDRVEDPETENVGSYPDGASWVGALDPAHHPRRVALRQRQPWARRRPLFGLALFF